MLEVDHLGRRVDAKRLVDFKLSGSKVHPLSSSLLITSKISNHSQVKAFGSARRVSAVSYKVDSKLPFDLYASFKPYFGAAILEATHAQLDVESRTRGEVSPSYPASI